MPLVRNAVVWIPLYFFLILWVWNKFGWKRAIIWTLVAIVVVSFSDLLSSHIIKPLVGRVRPCNEPTLAATFRNVINRCGENGSFTSSHAANHFSIAAFFYFSLRGCIPSIAWIFWLWAAAICYAQVYVGVHYPSDVVAGAMLGIIIGSFIYFFYQKRGFKLC